MKKIFIFLILNLLLNPIKILPCPRKAFHDQVLKTIKESNGIITLNKKSIVIDKNKMEKRYNDMPDSVFQQYIYKPLMIDLGMYAMNHYLDIDSLKDGKKTTVFETAKENEVKKKK
ncbi:hypothetical protein [Fusobacterium sp. PH5-44]|uniref:hypothetical protein n=1 Tax=unclassified Fusobacterium TaxID=2648384 RepID=UPI003D2212CA